MIDSEFGIVRNSILCGCKFDMHSIVHHTLTALWLKKQPYGLILANGGFGQPPLPPCQLLSSACAASLCLRRGSKPHGSFVPDFEGRNLSTERVSYKVADFPHKAIQSPRTRSSDQGNV